MLIEIPYELAAEEAEEDAAEAAADSAEQSANKPPLTSPDTPETADNVINLNPQRAIGNT